MLTLSISQTLQDQIELKKMNYAFENLNQPLLYLEFACWISLANSNLSQQEQQNQNNKIHKCMSLTLILILLISFRAIVHLLCSLPVIGR